MDESKQSEGLLLLQNENINEFNKWRMKNLTLKLAFDKIDFSRKNISNAFLNGNLNNTNFMGSNLQKADLQGSILNRTIFVEANLIDANTFGLDKNKAFLKSSKLKGTAWE